MALHRGIQAVEATTSLVSSLGLCTFASCRARGYLNRWWAVLCSWPTRCAGLMMLTVCYAHGRDGARRPWPCHAHLLPEHPGAVLIAGKHRPEEDVSPPAHSRLARTTAAETRANSTHASGASQQYARIRENGVCTHGRRAGCRTGA